MSNNVLFNPTRGIPLVLIVEDHADTAALIARALSQQPLALASAVTRLEAERYLAQSYPTIALIDYMLPCGDAAPLVTQLHRDRPLTEAVIMTGVCDARALAKRLGVKYYLQKPFLMEDLQRIVQTILDERFFD